MTVKVQVGPSGCGGDSAARDCLSPAELWRRRLMLLGCAVLSVGTARAGLTPTLPQAAARLSEAVDEIADRGPERALRRMVVEGSIRPAHQSDVEQWLDTANLSKNDAENISLRPGHSFVVLEEISLPSGMYGAHARDFLVPPGVAIPQERGSGSHNTIYLLVNGTCLGSGNGCGR